MTAGTSDPFGAYVGVWMVAANPAADDHRNEIGRGRRGVERDDFDAGGPR
jgi:hypothetical protein